MGYWSEVAIKCKPKAYKMFEAFLGKKSFQTKFIVMSITHTSFIGSLAAGMNMMKKFSELLS